MIEDTLNGFVASLEWRHLIQKIKQGPFIYIDNVGAELFEYLTIPQMEKGKNSFRTHVLKTS